MIGYPEALFTRRYGGDATIATATTNALLAQLGMTPDGTPPPVPPPKNTGGDVDRRPDPDVVSLEIVVEVRALAHDRVDGSFVEMYRTTRDVPPLAPIPVNPGQPIDLKSIVNDAPFTLQLQYLDVDDIAAPSVVPALARCRYRAPGTCGCASRRWRRTPQELIRISGRSPAPRTACP